MAAARCRRGMSKGAHFGLQSLHLPLMGGLVPVLLRVLGNQRVVLCASVSSVTPDPAHTTTPASHTLACSFVCKFLKRAKLRSAAAACL